VRGKAIAIIVNGDRRPPDRPVLETLVEPFFERIRVFREDAKAGAWLEEAG